MTVASARLRPPAVLERHRSLATALAMAAIGLGLPLLASLPPFTIAQPATAWIDGFTSAGIFVLLALGLNIVVGYAGLLDLGYAAFFAIGSYAWAYVASPFGNQVIGIPIVETLGAMTGILFWPMLAVGALIAAGFGILLGAPTLRLRGDYLAIVTLGFGEIVPIVILNADAVTNGTNGIGGVARPWLPATGLFPLIDPLPFYLTMLVLVTLALIASARLARGRVGRAWDALRGDETAAAASGVHPVTTKLLAFGLGAAIAGVAGTFQAAKLSTVSPDQFGFVVSFTVITAVVLGGMGNPWGVAAGAFAIYMVQNVGLKVLDQLVGTLGIPVLREIAFVDLQSLLFGVLLVLTVLLRPAGLLPRRRPAYGPPGTGREPGRMPADPAALAGVAVPDDRPGVSPATDEPAAVPAAAPALAARPAVAATPAPASAGSAPPLLAVRGVRRVFDGVVAVDGVDLDVADGSIVSIIGPNGAGKTTLFNIVAGHVAPSAGAVALDGRVCIEPVRRAGLEPVIWVAPSVLLGVPAACLVLGGAIGAPLAIAWLAAFLAILPVAILLAGATGAGWYRTLCGRLGIVRPTGAAAMTGAGVARTFQGIRLFGDATILEHVLIGMHTRLRGSLLDALLDRRRDEEAEAVGRAHALLALVGIEVPADRPAASLAYGDQRRLEIARALAAEPRLLLLDEPAAGMNPTETRQLVALIARIRRDLGITVLVIEHDMALVREISDRVVVLDHGVRIADGTPSEVARDPRVIEAYLGVAG